MSLNTPVQSGFPVQCSSRSGISSPQYDWHAQGQEDAEGTLPIAFDGAADGDHLADEVDDEPQIPFQPFFTLVEDAHTSDYHHPTIHYIFSDDDTDIVTEAALRSLDSQNEALSNSKKTHLNEELGDPEKSSLLPPPIPGVRENYLVLDIEPLPATNPAIDQPSSVGLRGVGDTKAISTSPTYQSQLPGQTPSPGPGPGVQHMQFRVTSAKSFSPTWQILNSEMSSAPTFENHDSGETEGHGSMLKIRGTSGLPADTGKEKGERGAQRLEEMMENFAKRMQELQVVIDSTNLDPTTTVVRETGIGHEAHAPDEVEHN
ncbi:hypothetical protein N7495_007348 [Penicillium taxi]|uniref:uncharacterized protein n=1 Tax=Penicillium taxi TaxID=168475 RepID=UPI0025457DAA|nr:uncharacterized protein N7495_007348 [Penicillium taxi]KAJ5895657.1 hypothetical protein N7495_007348 [Penicillium taxi]